METLLLPFSPRFIVLTICAVVTALLVGIGIFDHNVKVWEILLLPIVIFGALTALLVAVAGVAAVLAATIALMAALPAFAAQFIEQSRVIYPKAIGALIKAPISVSR